MGPHISRRVFVGNATLGAVAGLSGWTHAAFAADEPVAAKDYPSLSVEALGQLNRFHSLSRQLPGDWSGMGIQAVTQDGDDAYHWQLPFMAYALAVAQYSRTPAYRELYRESIDKLTEKMRRTDVWNYWEEASTGEDVFHDPKLVRKADPDPLRAGNVEYSGNALSMMALYEMLYRDGKWSRPNAFSLRRMTPKGVQEFDYDLPKLMTDEVQQFRDTGYLGMECEPDGIYPTTCNVFPVHAMIAYDATHGTDYARTIIPKHVAAWQKISGLYRTDHPMDAAFGLYPTRHEMRLSDPYTFGKLQFINVFAPEYAKAMYPRWREQLFAIDGQGALVIKPQPPAPMMPMQGHQMAMPARDARKDPTHEFFASVEQLAHKVGPVAAEMGDPELQAAAEKFLQQHNPQVWRDGEMYYERDDSWGKPSFMTRRGSIVIGSGRVWSKNSYHDLYVHPWTPAMLKTPEIVEVDYPRTLVQQAWFDARRGALIVTLMPHGLLPDSRQPRAFDTSFVVANLDPAKSYEILRDGRTIARVTNGRLDGKTASSEAVATARGPRITASFQGAPLAFVVRESRA